MKINKKFFAFISAAVMLFNMGFAALPEAADTAEAATKSTIRDEVGLKVEDNKVTIQ